MFSKILVALDREDTCTALFKEAVMLAQATGAELMLLSVLTAEGDDGLTMPSSYGLAYYPLSASEAVWEMYQENFEKYEAKGLEMLCNFREQAQAAGIHTEFTQNFGSPGRIICDVAKTWEADLILVGSHGRKGLNEMVLGSVSNYVMHHASCSVLVSKARPILETSAEAEELTAAAD